MYVAQAAPVIDEGAPARVARALSHWKVILVTFAFLLSAGVAFAQWTGSIATTEQVNQVRSAAGVAVDDLRAVTARVGALEEGNRWRDAALKAIADKLGVPVPDPPPSTL